jgi:hypothetical protein
MNADNCIVAMLNLGPCSMLPPHYHPRASNYVVATKGNTTTYMFGENGARLVQETLLPGRATIFPQGSMHMMVNNGKQIPDKRDSSFHDTIVLVYGRHASNVPLG